MERRVFVSMMFDDFLTQEQNNVKWAIIDKIIAAGLVPHFFFPLHTGQVSRKSDCRVTLERR